MTDCLPRHWIGAPLRAAFAGGVAASLPAAIDDLLVALDGDLARRTFSRDLTALMPTLRAYARSLTRDADAADDLVQDALLKAWKARAQFVPGTSLRAWTCTILRNAFLNQGRRARFEGTYDEIAAEERLARPEAQSAVVALGEVERAMARLHPDQRDALRLVALGGLSYAEGARRTGMSLAGFKSRVWRARGALRAIVAGDVPRDDPPTPPAACRAAAAPAVPRGDRHGAWAAAKAARRQFWIG